MFVLHDGIVGFKLYMFEKTNRHTEVGMHFYDQGHQLEEI